MARATYKSKTKLILRLKLTENMKEARDIISKFPLGAETLNLCIKQGMELDHELLVSIAQVCGSYSEQSIKFIEALSVIREQDKPSEDLLPEDSSSDMNKRAMVLLRNMEERREMLGLPSTSKNENE